MLHVRQAQHKSQLVYGDVQDPNERRGGVGAVAAGDDAEQMAVGYQLGYAPREVTIDFQV